MLNIAFIFNIDNCLLMFAVNGNYISAKYIIHSIVYGVLAVGGGGHSVGKGGGNSGYIEYQEILLWEQSEMSVTVGGETVFYSHCWQCHS